MMCWCCESFLFDDIPVASRQSPVASLKYLLAAGYIVHHTSYIIYHTSSLCDDRMILWPRCHQQNCYLRNLSTDTASSRFDCALGKQDEKEYQDDGEIERCRNHPASWKTRKKWSYKIPQQHFPKGAWLKDRIEARVDNKQIVETQAGAHSKHGDLLRWVVAAFLDIQQEEHHAGETRPDFSTRCETRPRKSKQLGPKSLLNQGIIVHRRTWMALSRAHCKSYCCQASWYRWWTRIYSIDVVMILVALYSTLRNKPSKTTTSSSTSMIFFAFLSEIFEKTCGGCLLWSERN